MLTSFFCLPLYALSASVLPDMKQREAERDAHLLTTVEAACILRQILGRHWMQQEPWLPQTACWRIQDQGAAQVWAAGPALPHLCPGALRLPGLPAAPLWRHCRLPAA